MLNTKWLQRLLLLQMDIERMNSVAVVGVAVEHASHCFDSNKMVHHSRGYRFFPLKLKLMARIPTIYCVQLLLVHHHLEAEHLVSSFDAHANRYHLCEDHFRCL